MNTNNAHVAHLPGSAALPYTPTQKEAEKLDPVNEYVQEQIRKNKRKDSDQLNLKNIELYAIPGLNPVEMTLDWVFEQFLTACIVHGKKDPALVNKWFTDNHDKTLIETAVTLACSLTPPPQKTSDQLASHIPMSQELLRAELRNRMTRKLVIFRSFIEAQAALLLCTLDEFISQANQWELLNKLHEFSKKPQ